MKLSPIILFTYKRPNVTRQIVTALQKCPEAKDSELYIFSDGSKDERDVDNVNDVREYLRGISGFSKINIFEASQNKGKSAAIIEGLSMIGLEHEAVIVLEDDLVVSKEFLSFMNRALDYYQQDKRIWSISGHSWSINIENNQDVYLSPRFSSRGWAIWRDRIQMIDWGGADYEQFVSSREIKDKFNQGGADLTPLLRMQQEGLIDSWAVRVAYCQYKYGMMTVHPVKTLVISAGIGTDRAHTSPKVVKPVLKTWVLPWDTY